MTKVLIVEDNLPLLDSITFQLEMHDYTVIQATNGQQALDLLRNGPLPHIIVSDISMPDMGGYEFLEAVRKVPAWNNIPFIFLTAFDSQNAIQTGKKLGVDDYLTKPFQPDDLIIAMENKLNRIAQFHKAAEVELDDMRDKLLQLISHELRTPLTLIFGGTEMLADTLLSIPDESTHKMLQIVQSGTARLNRLINNILYLVAIDGGQLDERIINTAELHDLVELTISAANAVNNALDLRKKDVRLNITPSKGPLMVRGVHDYLNLMLSEVIRNAFQYSPHKGIINIHFKETNDRVHVHISDQGPGIATEKQNFVWQRFAQIDRDVNEQQGIGLGLPLALSIAQKHNGDCFISYHNTTGTEIIIHLPKAL